MLCTIVSINKNIKFTLSKIILSRQFSNDISQKIIILHLRKLVNPLILIPSTKIAYTQLRINL